MKFLNLENSNNTHTKKNNENPKFTNKLSQKHTSSNQNGCHVREADAPGQHDHDQVRKAAAGPQWPGPWPGPPDAVQPEPLPARFPRAAPRTPPDQQHQGPRREGRLHGCGPSAFPQGDGEGRRGTDQGHKPLLSSERRVRQVRSGTARTCCLQPAPADWGLGCAELRPDRLRRQEGDGHAEETAGHCARARALRSRGRRRRRDCR